jgi:hypothetical protein
MIEDLNGQFWEHEITLDCFAANYITGEGLHQMPKRVINLVHVSLVHVSLQMVCEFHAVYYLCDSN